MDIFIFWPNWQDETKKLQEAFPQSDDTLWQSVAKDARSISLKRFAQLSLL
jgi:hypothetical protein